MGTHGDDLDPAAAAADSATPATTAPRRAASRWRCTMRRLAPRLGDVAALLGQRRPALWELRIEAAAPAAGAMPDAVSPPGLPAAAAVTVTVTDRPVFEDCHP